MPFSILYLVFPPVVLNLVQKICKEHLFAYRDQIQDIHCEATHDNIKEPPAAEY